jgi:hypothetical protein
VKYDSGTGDNEEGPDHEGSSKSARPIFPNSFGGGFPYDGPPPNTFIQPPPSVDSEGSTKDSQFFNQNEFYPSGQGQYDTGQGQYDT